MEILGYEELEMFTKVCKKRESSLTLEILLLIIANSAWQISVERWINLLVNSSLALVGSTVSIQNVDEIELSM